MRRVEVVALARRNNEQFTSRLQNSAPDTWPKFLKCAHAIALGRLTELIDGNASTKAVEIVISSVAAAHNCACAVSERALGNERTGVRAEIHSALKKLINPITRRTPIQREMDKVARREFADGEVDLEVMTRFFNGCADIVSKSDKPDAIRILGALGKPTQESDKPADKNTIRELRIINHYEEIHPADRAIVETKLRESIREHAAGLTVLGVLAAMIDALENVQIRELNERAGDLLTQYVAAVRAVWLQSGLHPFRGSEGSRSPFHRFLELILIDQFEPRSRLFDQAGKEELDAAREIHGGLPDDMREVASIGPRYQWLISEHFLRALEAD